MGDLAKLVKRQTALSDFSPGREVPVKFLSLCPHLFLV